MHALRKAMVRPKRSLLRGNVEVDETYVGDPEGFGPPIRLQQIPDVSGDNLVGLIRQTIMPGSFILIDGWKGYDGVESYL